MRKSYSMSVGKQLLGGGGIVSEEIMMRYLPHNHSFDIS